MSMKTTTTTYGMFGIAAVIAILSVSLIVTTTNTQTADALAANKVAWRGNDIDVSAAWTEAGGPVTNPVTTMDFDIKSSTGNDWLVDFTAECETFSEVQATGKKGKSSDTSGAQAGATVDLLVDDVSQGTWQICLQDLQIEADLNALIEYNSTRYCDDSTNSTCGGLQFVCALDDPNFETVECQQWIDISSKVAGSYNAKWVLMNLAGDTNLKIVVTANADESTDATSDGIPEDFTGEPNGVTSMVVVSKKIVIAEPIHIAQQDQP